MDRAGFPTLSSYFFYAQFFTLKNYCKKIGIKLIGDIPFYVSLNSADVWSNPECFKFDINESIHLSFALLIQ